MSVGMKKDITYKFSKLQCKVEKYKSTIVQKIQKVQKYNSTKIQKRKKCKKRKKHKKYKSTKIK